MKKLLVALTLITSACAPVLVPVAPRARFYRPRPFVVVRPAPVVVVPAPHVRVWW